VSRVHDALRRAEQSGLLSPPVNRPGPEGRSVTATLDPGPSLAGLLEMVEEIPFRTASDSLLIDVSRPHEAPMEEFRTLRTRLNHMKSLQPMNTVVVTSPSPAEGKSLSAANLALAQAHLAGNVTLLADFDFRRPIVHTLFQTDRSPGLTDYLLGKVPLHQAMRKLAGTNLYIMPAGEAVINPLELLNLREVKLLIDRLPTLFNWVILDSPPLLFAADANLLSTMCHGTLLVVRIGHTTIDSVTRAMQSLCNNNVLGIVVNGARRGELYSKYTYYHSYYTPKDDEVAEGEGAYGDGVKPEDGAARLLGPDASQPADSPQVEKSAVETPAAQPPAAEHVESHEDSPK
jgi:protein-tyrosine kinase